MPDDLSKMSLEQLLAMHSLAVLASDGKRCSAVESEARRREEREKRLVEACRKADALPEEVEREGAVIVAALRTSSNRGITAPAVTTFQRWARKFADIRATIAEYKE